MDIIKICRTHGNLTKERITTRKDNRYGQSKVRILCLICVREGHKRSYEKHKENFLARNLAYSRRNKDKIKEYRNKTRTKNKDKVNKACAIYREENKEKVKIMKRESWLKHKHKYLKRENERRLKFKHLNREHYRKIDAKRVEVLSDSYITKVLTNRTKLKPKDIPQSLIELKRVILKIKRKKKVIELDENSKELQ